MLFMMLAIALSMSAQDVDKECTVEVDKMLRAMNVQEMYAQSVVKIVQQRKDRYTNPDAVAKEIIDSTWPDVVQEYAKAYSKYLTLDDMRAINEFYASPAWQKMGRCQTEISNNLETELMSKWLSDPNSKYWKNMIAIIVKYTKL